MTEDSNPYQLPPEPTPLEELDATPNHEDRNLAIIAHLSGCAGIVAGGLVGFAGPLVIYLLKQDSPYVAAQAKEALNFQITLLIVAAVCIGIFALSCFIFFPVLFIPAVLQVLFGIIAAISVRDGDHYRYPFNLRLFR